MLGLGLPGLGMAIPFSFGVSGPRPELTTPGAISAPSGYYVGQEVEATLPVWTGDTQPTEAYWTLDGVDYQAVNVSDPVLVLPEQDGAVIGLRFKATNENGSTTQTVVGSAIISKPVLLTGGQLSTPNGFVHGQQATATLPDWDRETSSTAHWTLDGVNHVTVSGNNPLTIPNNGGQVLGLRFTATNGAGVTESLIIGSAIIVAPTVSTPASISAPAGYDVGAEITATIATFNGATTTEHWWRINGVNYVQVAGNNPLVVPNLEGDVISLRSTGTNAHSPINSDATGGTITVPSEGDAYSMWAIPNTIPPGADADTSDISVGMVVRANAAGYTITAVWFYKTSTSPGGITTRPVRIYSPAGAVLASGASVSEPAGPAWIRAPLDDPHELAADEVVVAAVYYAGGKYPAGAPNYNTPKTFGPNGDIEYVSFNDADAGVGNGRYHAATGISYPDETFGNENYWVDIEVTDGEVVIPDIPPTKLTNGSISAPDGWYVGEQVTATLPTFADADSVAAHWQIDGVNAVTVSGNNPWTLPDDVDGVVRVRVVATGDGLDLEDIVAGSTILEVPSGLTFQTFLNHATENGGTGQASTTNYTLGMVYRPLVDGYITEISFWKPSNNTVTSRTVGLFTLAGVIIDTAQTSGEPTGTGQWITVQFDEPIPVTANTNYVAAVEFVGGHAVWNSNTITTDVTRGELMRPASASVSGGNGRYLAGGNPVFGFPNTTFNAPNYWIDVGFEYDPDAEPVVPPSINTPGSLTASNSYIVGSTVTCVLPTWNNADTVNPGMWRLNSADHLPIAGNNPLTVPNNPGFDLSARFSAVGDGETVIHTLPGGIISPVVDPAWPNASNTGASGTLTNSGSVFTSSNGQVIQNLNISGSIMVQHNNVTINNCRITQSAVDFYCIIGYQGQRSGLTISNCTINGSNNTAGGIWARGYFHHNNIYGVENGIITTIGNHPLNAWPSSIYGCEVAYNWIHDLNHTGKPSPHIDGVENDGGNIHVHHNFIDLTGWTQTSCVMIDNYFGNVSLGMVENNKLLGGGYNIYVDDHFTNGFTITSNGVTIRNNRFGGGFGSFQGGRLYPTHPPIIQSGNVIDATGAAVTL